MNDCNSYIEDAVSKKGLASKLKGTFQNSQVASSCSCGGFLDNGFNVTL